MKMSRFEIDLTNIMPTTRHTTGKGDLRKWFYNGIWYKESE